MALFNFFKPKWQHSDPNVRQQAVVTSRNIDIPTLTRLAASDPAPEVRQAALSRLDDWHLLVEVARPGIEPSALVQLTERIDHLQLAELLAAQGVAAKMNALANITKESLLARVAEEEPEPELRLAAVGRIENQEILAEIVTKNCGKAPALLAVDTITDESLLRRVAKEASSRSARARAQEKIEAIETERNRPSLEALRQIELNTLQGQAQQLTQSANLRLALEQCRAIQARLLDIALPADPQPAEVERCYALLTERLAAETARQEAEQQAIQQRQEQLKRLQHIPSEIQALALATEGKEEDSLSALQEEWVRVAAALGSPLPDDLLQSYRAAEEAFQHSRTLIDHESAEEAKLLQALAAIPSFIEANDLEQALESLSEAQRTFYGWKPQVVTREKVTACLERLQEQHRAATAQRQAAQNEARQANLLARQALLVEMQAQLAVLDIKQAEQRIKEIKEIWRRPVDLPPEAEALQPLFAETSRCFAEKLAKARKEENWKRWQNKNIKETLVAEAEALEGQTDLHQLFKQIKELQEKWRLTGPAPAKEEASLWRHFKQTTERQFSRCREYFQELDAQAEANLQEKIRLRDLAILQQESSEWQKTTALIKDLQRQWKVVGRGPKGKEQEVFSAFHEACDHFFERRKAHHAALELERQANLDQKEALCLQAEALADVPEITHKPKFQGLQTSWKTIGPATREQDEVIWRRFREACNRYYDWLDSLRPQNLSQKEALCIAVEELTATLSAETNFFQISKKIVALQQQWKEIGPVPTEQQEAIWQRFKGGCDVFFAAKKAHDQEIDQQRPANGARKEAFLQRITELSQAAISRESVKEMLSIQEEWQQLGPGEKEKERSRQESFKSLCDTFFKERREALNEIDKIHQDNLKKKEALCLRLEILAGISPPPVNQGQGKKGGLTLAEQLKVAFETNFVLSADDERDKKKRSKEEVEGIKTEWLTIGALPREHEYAMRKRYATALEKAMKG